MVFIMTTLPNPTERLGVGLVVEVLKVGVVVVVFDALNADAMVFLPADSFVGVLCVCLCVGEGVSGVPSGVCVCVCMPEGLSTAISSSAGSASASSFLSSTAMQQGVGEGEGAGEEGGGEPSIGTGDKLLCRPSLPSLPSLP